MKDGDVRAATKLPKVDGEEEELLKDWDVIILE